MNNVSKKDIVPWQCCVGVDMVEMAAVDADAAAVAVVVAGGVFVVATP